MAQRSRIAKILTAAVTIPVAILLILFAVSNRETVDLTLWPLPYSVTLPLFLVVLGFLFLGFILGALFMWVEVLRARGHARAEAKRADSAERTLEDLRRDRRLAVDPSGIPSQGTLPARTEPTPPPTVI
ncbi:MAG: LapA family protein [Alphaproteobacteria bacterium]|nr:LapA family protein [Alphaproteobacteria bacterium]MBU0797262.1 LapA family protein [Alphaproteobacteria bacterium]MBU0888950.1 LapA family protein [Alphaproteobacteria bacterium]MBU1813970.1 LapA family protein [Alphaproteobacteria bacterium]MBU2090655.1 LapA family protein [Alphaproteobacteria bacterium]